MLTTKKTKALTLVEVLLFVWVLALLTCLFLGWREPKMKTARYGHCLGQLRQICLAMKAYANDDVKNQMFPMLSPTPASSNELFDKTLVALEYVKDTKVFRCPSDRHIDPAVRFPSPNTNSYASAHNVKDDGSEDTPILADSLGHLSAEGMVVGMNVFFVDGHGVWSSRPPELKERVNADYGVTHEQLAATLVYEKQRRDNFQMTFRVLTYSLVVVLLLGGGWAIQRSRRKNRSEVQDSNS